MIFMPMSNRVLKDDTIEKIIYGYYHIPSERFLYVGITTDLRRRNWEHRSATCKQRDVFHDMLHTNPNEFNLEVLERVKGDATGKEAFWIDLLKPLNLCDGGFRLGNPLTEEAKKKIGDANRGRPCSEEAREKLRQASKGVRNPMYGKKGVLSPNHKIVLQFTKDGVFIKEYSCTREAERCLGVQHSQISRCCLGKRKSAGGYLWKYK